MMKKFLVLTLMVVGLSGCAVVDSLQSEDVTIDSKPQGADVYISGVHIGETPLTITLNKTISHGVTIKKEGYKELFYIIGTESVNPFIKFGPLVDAGYYYELVPNPSESNMQPDFLPDVVGTKPYDEMMDAIVKADSMKADGKVDDDENKYMKESIVEFYAPGTKADAQKKAEMQKTYDSMLDEVIALQTQQQEGKISNEEYKARLQKLSAQHSSAN